MIPDLVIAQLVEFDFAPVEGAAERLAVLDGVVAEIGPMAPEAFRAEIEIRRAGQLVSLARLDEALEASCRAFDGGAGWRHHSRVRNAAALNWSFMPGASRQRKCSKW